MSGETRLERLRMGQLEMVEHAFFAAFSGPPWNDDWSDKKQLRAYMTELLGCPNSLAFGLFEGEGLVGAALGHVRHWYEGTEYYVDELFILPQRQGRGLGSEMLRGIVPELRKMGVRHIFLLTERNVPAYEFYLKNGFRELEKNAALCRSV